MANLSKVNESNDIFLIILITSMIEV